MNCGEKTQNEGNMGEPGFCCGPRIFQEMFEKMAGACAGRGDFPDCKAVMESMMGMEKKENCSGQKTGQEDASRA